MLRAPRAWGTRKPDQGSLGCPEGFERDGQDAGRIAALKVPVSPDKEQPYPKASNPE